MRSFENLFKSFVWNKGFVYIEKRAIIIFEDDGPGIPEDQYKNV